MNSLYGLLKSPNCLSMLNGDNFVVGRSKSRIKPSIFTAKNILKYCRLFVEPLKTERPLGLALLPIIATEPEIKYGIIRRCDLPLRISSGQSCNGKQNIINQHNITDSRTSILPRKNESVIQQIPDSTDTFLPRKQDSVILLTTDSTSSQVVLENMYYDKGPKLLSKRNESVSSLPPMLVNDIKSFALLDAKFREDAERYSLSNESFVTETEEFIRDIKPTYSDAQMKSCMISKHADDEVQKTDCGSEAQISTVLKQDKSTEVIMYPRPNSSKKRDPVINEEQVDKKKPVMSKLKLMTMRKDMFKKEKEKGWRIRESYQIYKEKHSSIQVSRPCASELATSKSTSSHPPVMAVTSTRLLLGGSDKAADKNRRNKEAEKRIRASFNAFVERQNQGRTLRALKEQ